MGSYRGSPRCLIIAHHTALSCAAAHDGTRGASKTESESVGTRLVNAINVRGIYVPLATLLFLFVGGCGSAPIVRAPAWEGWANREGGLVQGVEQQRAATAVSRLTTAKPLNVCAKVVATQSIGAWAWHDGTLFLSIGLMRLLNDDELCAVAAHEMGHLRADGRLTEVAALNGCGGGPEAEIRADCEGCRMLESHGVAAKSLASALRKVRGAPGVSESVRAALDFRIRLLGLH